MNNELLLLVLAVALLIIAAYSFWSYKQDMALRRFRRSAKRRRFRLNLR